MAHAHFKRILISSLICAAVSLVALPETLACGKAKASRKASSSKVHKQAALAKVLPAKKVRGAKNLKAKNKKWNPPSRVRIIDTGKQVTADNFPIPDLDAMNSKEDMKMQSTSGSADFSSQSEQDQFADFEN